METFVSVTGIAAAMLQINIDTDQIIPARYLGGTDAKGYGAHLFANARFLPDGSPNPEFVLNQPPWDHAQVLLADRNFGCGSSRERAPKALREFGIRSIVAPSFGGIFFNNCFRNGVLPVTLPIEQVRELAALVQQDPAGRHVTVDLASQTVRVEGTAWSRPFKTPETLRQMLMQGVDEIDQTMGRKPLIEAWRAQDRARRPWAYTAPAPVPLARA